MTENIVLKEPSLISNNPIGNFDLPPILFKWLRDRPLTDLQIAELLSLDLKALPNLENLQDLEKAAKRIILANANKEKIAIFGDYDVDGTTSCALLFHFFKLINVEVELFQPGRFIEGYGLHLSSIDAALEKNIKVLITVDCGITSHSAAQYAKEKLIDLIITDHHKDIAENLPDAFAVINPNRRDEDLSSELTSLAGVGVAFVLALKIKRLLEQTGEIVPGLYPLLQFVALGTLCDMAKLTPTNLKLVRHGLKIMTKECNLGLRTFFTQEDLNLEMIQPEKLTFEVGPMINSKGRLDHPEIALNLLVTPDCDIAFNNHNHLEICNRERKSIQAQIFDEAKKMALAAMTNGLPPVLVLYSPDWHEGVIGIVASKMVETFSVSTVIFTNSEHQGFIKASARANKGGDIFNILKECQDLYHKFGGHKAAAGLTMSLDNLNSFKERIGKLIIPQTQSLIKHYDIEISSGDITPKLYNSLSKIGPFGEGNPRPVFLCKDLDLVKFTILKDLHVKWTFRGKGPELTGISFYYLQKFDLMHPQEILKELKNTNIKPAVYFNLDINRFRGNTFLQLMVSKVEIPFS